MILNVLTYPDPILRLRAVKVSVFDAELASTMDNMLDTMRASNGVGLAATQVGILSRLFVVEYNQHTLKIINPEIIKTSGEVAGEEACLSLPGVARIVKRAKNLTLKYQDINGTPIETAYRGFIARIIQHELDHLDGILITDRSSEEPSE